MTYQELLAQFFVYCVPLNIFIVFISYVVLNFIGQVIYYRFFHPLKNFPGPFWWSVTRLPLAWHNFWDTENERTMALVAQYGPIIRTSPTLLHVSSASSLPQIYTKRAAKTGHYTLFSFGFEPTVFHMRSHEEYAPRAKMVAGIYSTRAVMPSTEVAMDRHNGEWVRKLAELYAAEGKAFNLAKWVQFLTMDVIIELALGGSEGENENDLGFVRNGRDMLNLCWGFKIALPFYGVVCRLHTFTNWINETWFGTFFNFFMLKVDPLIGNQMRFVDRALKKRLEEIAKERVAGVKGEMGEKTDMMQSFINARTKSGDPMSTTTLNGEMLIVLMAGADNTTAAICTALHHILSSTSALSRVLSELSSLPFSTTTSSPPSLADLLAHCPFYIACVRESLRLNPPLPSYLPRIADEGTVIHSWSVPAGVEVASNPWIVQRDPEVYGADAETWRPERWLESPERCREMERASGVFGWGSRLCLGRGLGWMSAVKVPALFLKTFETQLVEEDGKKGHVTVRADFSYWEDFLVRVKVKNGMPV